MDTQQSELELSIIKKIIEDSRNAVYDSGLQGIFWSILLAVTLIINYIIIITRTGLQYIGLIWLVFMSLGIVISILLGRKEKKKIKTATFAGKVLVSVWISIGVSNSIFAFASVIAKAFHPVYIIPLDSFVLGIGFYITGIIQQIKFLRLLSILWFAEGAFFLVFPSIHSILIFSLMLMVSLLIPTVQNRYNWKKISKSVIS